MRRPLPVPRRAGTGGRPQRIPPLQAWAADHVRVLGFALRRLAQHPIGSLLTCSVVALSLGLPATFYALLDNVQRAVGRPHVDAAVTVYLKAGTSEARARELARGIAAWESVTASELITAQEALHDLEAQGALGGALQALETNPLPHTVLVTPASTDAEHIRALEAKLEAVPEVDTVHLEWKWIERLQTLLELARRAGIALAAALAVAALLAIGNTIRLDIESRREEVVVAQLLGATDAFVRRPFLYTGLLYGLIGALGAWLLVAIVILWLSEPVAHLAALYGARFELH
ncbi:MAG TPA: ABC transporter permease, partial [Thiotrichales bacterium]|nr:ABC transporter permease [Thiotrichales bacterium]